MSASYVLTPTARRHLREAKAWLLTRWGQELTKQYFQDLHKAANSLARHHHKYAERKNLTGESNLKIYLVREHYIVYETVERNKIAIVAFIRQGRDIPAILTRNASLFQFELNKSVEIE